MTQTARQDFGWPDGLGCCKRGASEGEGLDRASGVG
jgi:hypothetical protein